MYVKVCICTISLVNQKRDGHRLLRSPRLRVVRGVWKRLRAVLTTFFSVLLQDIGLNTNQVDQPYYPMRQI